MKKLRTSFSYKHLLALGFTTVFLNPAFANDNLQKLTQDDSQWVHPRKDYANTGYSSLSQIKPNNINKLALAWTFSTGVNRGHEGSPIVLGNVMYVHTAFPNNIYALDLNNNQKILWSYFPKQDPQTQALLCCDTVNRGLAYGDSKIFLQQNDGVLVALDAKSGQPIWQTKVNDIKTGASNTNAPHVMKDKVITGCSGGEYGVGCFIANQTNVFGKYFLYLAFGQTLRWR